MGITLGLWSTLKKDCQHFTLDCRPQLASSGQKPELCFCRSTGIYEGTADRKQSNDPIGPWSHIGKSASKKVPKRILVLGFFRLFPCQDPAIKVCRCNETSVGLDRRGISYPMSYHFEVFLYSFGFDAVSSCYRVV